MDSTVGQYSQTSLGLAMITYVTKMHTTGIGISLLNTSNPGVLYGHVDDAAKPDRIASAIKSCCGEMKSTFTSNL